jgi:hypothetical protein
MSMTEWDSIGCQRGCESHPTRLVDVHLGGMTRYHDYTPIPNRFAMDFTLEVWDTDLMPVDHDPVWCPAHDAVSETIIALGVWEPQETTVLLLAWEALDWKCEFVDVGCQIGWFTAIANKRGVDVTAFEADGQVWEVAQRNAHPGLTEIHHTRVGEWTPPEEVLAHVQPQVVAKIDIEGAEEHAIRMLGPLIDEGRVPFILMEVSPCFNDSYPELVTSLLDRGYHAYNLPPKQNPPVRIDQLADLLPYRLVGDYGEVVDQVAAIRQCDMVFVLGGVAEWS